MESRFLSRGLDVLGVFFGEEKEWVSNGRVVFDKSAVKIAEA